MTPETKAELKATDIVLTVMLDGRWRTLSDVMRKAQIPEDDARGALKGLTKLGALASEDLQHKARVWRLAGTKGSAA